MKFRAEVKVKKYQYKNKCVYQTNTWCNETDIIYLSVAESGVKKWKQTK